ncbi:MAG: type II toxin-antitoxin system VapC family toxin [Chloroflexia bacterium]
MAVYYFDTSALVKRYVLEVGMPGVTNLANGAEHQFYTVRISGPELIAALYRRSRRREIPSVDVVALTVSFKTDWLRRYEIVEVSNTVAVHLSTALELQISGRSMRLSPITFVSADEEQLRAAQAEGLLTENPNSHG